jgi:hypothetical protein
MHSDAEKVTDAFYRDLEFGTAGLRGVLGAGTNRMNIYVIRRATQAVAQYLNETELPKTVAIGHDSRIKSDVFAREAAAVFAANGITAYLYPRLEPVPALSFAVRHLHCGLGVCVTASHNPAEYNGYKVYGSDGCQMTPEAAKRVVALLEHMDYFTSAKTTDFDAALACHSRFAAKNHGMVEKFEEEVRAARGDIQVRRIGYYDGGQLRGYVAYRFESASDSNYTQNRLSVEELVYEDGAVLRALLGALRLQEDLAQTVILRTGEEDFHHLLDDPQDISKNYIDYGFLQTNVSAIGTMFKLVDGEMFVEKTAYRTFPAGTLTAAFRYRDEMADCEKCLRIAFDGGRWAVAAADSTADVTVICRQGDLASLLMGSCGLEAMLRLGAATADNDEKARELARLLHYGQKPWLNSDY